MKTNGNKKGGAAQPTRRSSRCSTPSGASISRRTRSHSMAGTPSEDLEVGVQTRAQSRASSVIRSQSVTRDDTPPPRAPICRKRPQSEAAEARASKNGRSGAEAEEAPAAVEVEPMNAEEERDWEASKVAQLERELCEARATNQQLKDEHIKDMQTAEQRYTKLSSDWKSSTTEKDELIMQGEAREKAALERAIEAEKERDQLRKDNSILVYRLIKNQKLLNDAQLELTASKERIKINEAYVAATIAKIREMQELFEKHQADLDNAQKKIDKRNKDAPSSSFSSTSAGAAPVPHNPALHAAQDEDQPCSSSSSASTSSRLNQALKKSFEEDE